MIINPEIRGRLVPLLAPVGAAAYTVKETEGGATLYFGMIKPGEDGLSALLRTRKTYPGERWAPTSARPEEQRTSSEGPELTKCELVEKDGYFVGKTSAAQAFLEAMRRMSNLPVKATHEMVATADELSAATQ